MSDSDIWANLSLEELIEYIQIINKAVNGECYLGPFNGKWLLIGSTDSPPRDAQTEEP